MMRKFVLFMALLMAATTGVVAKADDTRTFEPLDRSLNYRFDYPLATHSVRTSNIAEPATDEPIVFGALISVEPNDIYLYAANAPQNRATRMRVLAIPTAQTPALKDLPGTLPMWTYDASEVTVKAATLGDQPAVRVDDPDRSATEIIAYYDKVIYEIVIDTIPLSMGFHLPKGTAYDPVYDTILKSWKFVQLAQN